MELRSIRLGLKLVVGLVLCAHPPWSSFAASITPNDLCHYSRGSILNGSSSAPGNDECAPPSKWLTPADRFYEASMHPPRGSTPSPMMRGADAVHGHGNPVRARTFPHNMALAVAHD